MFFLPRHCSNVRFGTADVLRLKGTLASACMHAPRVLASDDLNKTFYLFRMTQPDMTADVYCRHQHNQAFSAPEERGDERGLLSRCARAHLQLMQSIISCRAVDEHRPR